MRSYESVGAKVLPTKFFENFLKCFAAVDHIPLNGIDSSLGLNEIKEVSHL
jgi:hypothetical protein